MRLIQARFLRRFFHMGGTDAQIGRVLKCFWDCLRCGDGQNGRRCGILNF